MCEFHYENLLYMPQNLIL